LQSTLNITDLTNERAFEQVFKSFYQPLTAFAFQYVDDHEVAEEVVQEMFSSIWTKASQIEIRTTIKSYLYGAVRNACLNHLKHEKIKRKYEEHEMYNSEYDEVNFLELEELQEEIDKALAGLPEKCREIFEMSRYEEKKYKEIADELGLSIKTVETQMGRALKHMRTSLGRYLPVWLVLYYLWNKYL